MRRTVLLILLGVFVVSPIVAQDFKYTYEGQTITYTVTDSSNKTVRTKMAVQYDGLFQQHKAGNTVSGTLILPAHPIYGGVEYTLTEIPDNAFYGNDELISVTIPNTVTKLGLFPFYLCNNLTAINVDSENQDFSSVDGVLYDKNASLLIQFPGGKSYTKIPDTVTKLKAYSFAYNQNLTSIEIPNSVEIIGSSAFRDCKNLSSVKFGNSITTISESAFASCYKLSSIELPNTVTSIGNFAFIFCREMKFAKLGASVTTIGPYAFFYCEEMTSLEVSGAIKTIDGFSFECCEKLDTVYYNTSNPASLKAGFGNQKILYARPSAVDKCKEIEPWKWFENIIPYNFSGIDVIENDESEGIDRDKPYVVYKPDGRRVADSVDGLPKGLYILRQGSRGQKIAVK